MKVRFPVMLAACVCALSLALPAAARGGSERLKPQWMRKLPSASNPSFEYVLKSAHAPTVSEARDACKSSIISEAGFNKGVLVTVNEQSSMSVRQHWEGGKLVDRESQNFDMNADIKGEGFKLYIREVAEYYEFKAGGYELTRLYQKSTGEAAPSFDKFVLTDRYGIAPMFISVIPGAGQFCKGDALKGSLMLASVSACAIGAVLFNSRASDYSAKMSQSHDAEVIRFNRRMADESYSGEYVCLGVGLALYLYNLIDAAVAPGARRIVVTNSGVSLNF